MIAVVPPLWAILIVLLIVGAAALLVVVCGLLWIWGRRAYEEGADDGFARRGVLEMQDELNYLTTRKLDAAALFTPGRFIPVTGDPREVLWPVRVARAIRRRPYDWAHRTGYLNPDGHLITHRGELLGKTEWPPATSLRDRLLWLQGRDEEIGTEWPRG